MARPSPVPPAAAPVFVCANASKISVSASGSMPDAGVADLEAEMPRSPRVTIELHLTGRA